MRLAVTESEVNRAWMNWQSELSRDMGYNHDKCRALETKYRQLKLLLEEQSK